MGVVLEWFDKVVPNLKKFIFVFEVSYFHLFIFLVQVIGGPDQGNACESLLLILILIVESQCRKPFTDQE